MLTLRDQVVTRAAVERISHQRGELVTYVVAKIRGNYQDGPVPVTVHYGFHFQYNDQWADVNGVNATTRDFSSSDERNTYVNVHFALDA